MMTEGRVMAMLQTKGRDKSVLLATINRSHRQHLDGRHARSSIHNESYYLLRKTCQDGQFLYLNRDMRQ